MAATAVMMVMMVAVMRTMVMAAVRAALAGEGERQIVNWAAAAVWATRAVRAGTVRGKLRKLGKLGTTRIRESGDHNDVTSGIIL